MATKKAVKPDYTYKARILKAFDGDTFTAQVDMGFGVTQTVQFNLANANAYEVRGETLEQGRAAKEATQKRIVGKDVIIRTHKTKLKGRYAAEVYIDGEDLGQELIKSGHAKAIKE